MRRFRFLAWLLAPVFALLLVTPANAGKNYLSIDPSSIVSGAQPFDVGPWGNYTLGGCPDWLGSFLWSYTPECVGICNSSCPCLVVGDGFAYPSGWPCVAGVPNCTNPSPTVPGPSCYTTKKYGTADLANGWHYVSYSNSWYTGGIGSAGPWTSETKCKSERAGAQSLGLTVGSGCFYIFH